MTQLQVHLPEPGARPRPLPFQRPEQGRLWEDKARPGSELDHLVVSQWGQAGRLVAWRPSVSYCAGHLGSQGQLGQASRGRALTVGRGLFCVGRSILDSWQG